MRLTKVDGHMEFASLAMIDLMLEEKSMFSKSLMLV